MNRNNNIDEAIQAFLSNGGEITHLKYADQKMQNKARRMAFHKDKAMTEISKIIGKEWQEKKKSSD